MRLAWVLPFVLCANAAAQQPDYFPLHVGNQWVYRVGGTRPAEPLVLSITRGELFDGRHYVLLEGWPRGNFWLRQDEKGDLYRFNTETRQDELWYSFFAEPGRVYRNQLPWCCGQGRVASRDAEFRGPIGSGRGALEVGDPTVFQIGLVKELFLPYVGLVSRFENVGGPAVATYDLIYARTGGVTVVEEPQVSFRLTLDGSLYYSDQMPPLDPRRAVPQLTARITLRNTQPQPLRLTFPSGQLFELVIRNDKGETVHTWSANKLFPQVVQSLEFGHGEHSYIAVARLGAGDRPLPEGRYTAEAWLTTQGRIVYSATAGFEIMHVF